MELRKLKSFLVVAKELHFGKAAKKLNITQPALTHQISQLESELGYDLFDKEKRINNRKVELTDAGAYLMKEITRVIDLLDRTLKSAKINSQKINHLKLGIPKFLLASEVIEIIELLKIKFPDTIIKIKEFSTSLSVQEELYKGNVDIGVTTLPLVFKDLDFQRLGTEYVNIILPKTHPLAKYKKIKIEQLRNDNWIDLSTELYPGILEEVELFCRNAGFSRDSNIIQSVSNVELLIGLVNTGLGISLFSSQLSPNSDGIVSKEIFFSDDNTRLEVKKVIAFKSNFDNDYKNRIGTVSS